MPKMKSYKQSLVLKIDCNMLTIVSSESEALSTDFRKVILLNNINRHFRLQFVNATSLYLTKLQQNWSPEHDSSTGSIFDS